ncbi:glycoside hydrolase family 16 protein [Lactarius tabidus]
MVSLRAVLLALVPALVRGTPYTLTKEYFGSSFFEGWNFFGNVDDLTHGNANFVTAAQAAALQLAYINSAGNAIIKVDNTTVVPPNSDRNTVRITTEEAFPVGNLWIVDMLHVPFGVGQHFLDLLMRANAPSPIAKSKCSVWPAFWSYAVASNWPAGGEIDTFEAVNNVLNAQMALHTEPGCTVVNAVQTSTLVNTTDCNVQADENMGCVVENPDRNSYGAAFAAAGGGVFATELAEEGISIWFFERQKIPSSISRGSTSVDTSTFGVPVANFPATGCTIDTFFEPQNLVFDITLCGDFAGNPTIFAQTCQGSCYNNFVIGPPSNYNNAYFEIQYLQVFSSTPTINPRAAPNGTTIRRSAGLAGSSGARHAKRRGSGRHWT